MPYLLIDDGMSDNPKVAGLSDRAFRLWITTLVYCARHLNNGAISELALVTTAVTCKIRRKKGVVEELISAGLWEVTDQGWQVHDYLKYNPSRDEIEARRELARERKRRHRSKGHAGQDGGTGRVSHATQDPPKGVSKETPRGSSPAGSHGTSIAKGATGTRSTSPPLSQREPEPDVVKAPPPPELLNMLGIPIQSDNSTPLDAQDQALIDKLETERLEALARTYADQEPDW